MAYTRCWRLCASLLLARKQKLSRKRKLFSVDLSLKSALTPTASVYDVAGVGGLAKAVRPARSDQSVLRRKPAPQNEVKYFSIAAHPAMAYTRCWRQCASLLLA